MNQNPDADSSSGSSRQFYVDSGAKDEEVLSVSAVTERIRSMLERGLGEVWVKGEISNVGFPPSGHVYFDLKDEEAKLPVALFQRHARNVPFDIEDGLEVRAYGQISAYRKRGTYQMKAHQVLPLGEGALRLAFEQLRDTLREEGLFKAVHKSSLPFLPRRIALVTSPTGAAVRDMIRTIRERSPQVPLLVVPVQVQGDDAKHEIARAIDRVNEHDLADVMIVGRGGGSLEDLWAFNEERVARAIFRSDIPVISGVGHEVDTTISDLVADRAVPTPTAAGQGVVPDRLELVSSLAERFRRIDRVVRQTCSDHRRILENARTTLSRYHPEKKLERWRDILSRRLDAIDREVRRIFDAHDSRVASVADQLESLNPLDVLKRGYSITRKQETDDILTDTDELEAGDRVETKLSGGSFVAEVTSVDDE